MRICLLAAAASCLAATVPAQAWYIPNSSPTGVACNVIPFGDLVPSATWGNQKYQTIVMASDLGSTAGIITGLGFSPCGSGDRDFDAIQIVMDHIPAATTTLSTVFASNLTPNAVTVLNATNFTWRQFGNTWTDIGLQSFFVFNGVDNLVIDVTLFNSRGNQGTPPITVSGMNRETRQRVYAFGWSGTPPVPPLSGNTDMAALKMEITMLMARTSLHGRGCPQSNGVRPDHTYTGTPQLGQPMSFDLGGALPNSVAVLAVGTYTGIPFPMDLASYGFPGCFAYFAIANTVVAVASPAGTASVPVTVPSSTGLVGGRLYSQYFCLNPNTSALTSSNYGQLLIGN
jgi:hypothetical protein